MWHDVSPMTRPALRQTCRTFPSFLPRDCLRELTGSPPAAPALSPRASCAAGWPTCGALRNYPVGPLHRSLGPGRGPDAASCNNRTAQMKVASHQADLTLWVQEERRQSLKLPFPVNLTLKERTRFGVRCL